HTVAPPVPSTTLFRSRGIAIALARAGARVVVNDLGASLAGEGGDTRPAAQAVDEIVKAGGTAAPNFGSVADFAEATAMVEQVIRSEEHTSELLSRVDL